MIPKTFAWREYSPAVILAALISFCIAANGAHDYWAATAVYVSILAFATTLIVQTCWPNDGPGLSKAFVLPAASVAIVLAVSFAGSVHPEESWFSLMDWFSGLLLFLITRHLFSERKYINLFLACLVPVLCLETFVILYQHIILARAPDAPQGVIPLLRYFLSLQVPGTLVNSSAATAFFLLWIPVYGSRLLESWNNGRSSWVWFIGFMSASIGLLLLNSHWGMLCLVFIIFSVSGPRHINLWIRRNPRRAAVSIALILGVVVWAINWKLTHAHSLAGRALTKGETTERIYWWVSGVRMLHDFPFFGVGIGNFASAYQAYKHGLVQNTLYPHNFLIGLLAETGIIGTAALFLFVLHVLNHANLRRTVEEKWPYLLGLLSFMIFGLIGLGLEYLVNVLSCALLLGVIASPPDNPHIKLPRSVILIVIGAAVFVLPFLLAPLMASRACVEGRRLLSQGRSHDAVGLFASAAQLDPRSSSAHHGWAQALSRTGSPSVNPEIILHLTRAIQLDRLNLALQNELQRSSNSH